MREIKFRFFDTYTSLMTPWEDVKHTGLELESCFEMVSMKSMQFTGLQDKSGVDIYEGDIVKDDNGYNRAISIGPFGADAEDYDSGDYYQGQVPDTFPWLEFEVIGNIHSNPELLEK